MPDHLSLGTGYKGEIEGKLSVRPEMDVRNQKQMIILKTVIVNQLYVQIITSKTYKVESKICLTNQSMFTKTLSKKFTFRKNGLNPKLISWKLQSLFRIEPRINWKRMGGFFVVF